MIGVRSRGGSASATGLALIRYAGALGAHARLALAALLVLAAPLAGCERWGRPPNYGSLQVEPRTFEFAHDVELLEVANGMRVALVRDTRTNLVTVDVRYEVGSAEDPPGRAGMAHLVEHLLFEIRRKPGGPTLADELSELALSYNAWTRPDETHYTTTAPADKLDALIAIEARRLQVRCDQLDEATFARERDVVLAEEAQRAGPRDALFRSLFAAIYGAAHPYARAWGASGVAAITRDEVCAFIAAHYTPERAVLVVTGPIDPRRTIAAIGPAFGPIARGRGTRAPLPAWTLGGSSEHTGPVERPVVIVAFPTPAWGARGAQISSVVDAQLAAALDELAADKPWVRTTSVSRIGDHRARMTAVFVEIDDAARARDAARFVYEAGNHVAMKGEAPLRVRDRRGALELEVVAAWDRLGDRGAWLASYLQYTPHRWFMLRDLAELHDLQPHLLETRARSLVPARAHVALVRPAPGTTGGGALAPPPMQSHDLEPWRTPVDPAEARRPLAAAPSKLTERTEKFALPNGLRVVLAPDPRSPIVDARIIFRGGTAHEPRDRPGLANTAAILLAPDLEGRFELAEAARMTWAVDLGTQVSHEVAETVTVFTVRGLRHYADWHVWRLAWHLDHGVYDAKVLELVKTALREARAKEKGAAPRRDVEPVSRILERLFGTGHPYAQPPYQAEAVLALGHGDLDRWRDAHYRVRGATLVISGGFDAARMRQLVGELFGPLSGAPPAALPAVPQPTPMRAASWLAVRDEERAQSQLTIAFQSRSDPELDEAARAVLARIVEDRLRLVREGMGASYGVHATYAYGAGGGALVISGKVDPARTADVLERVLAELAAVRAAGPGFDVDFVRARRRALAAALAFTGGASATAETVQRLVTRALDLDHAAKVAAQIGKLTPSAVAAVAAADLAAARMVVQVAGPAAAVDAAFARAGVTPD